MTVHASAVSSWLHRIVQILSVQQQILICPPNPGLNTGQHIYLDASAFLSGSQVSTILTFVFLDIIQKPADSAINMNS